VRLSYNCCLLALTGVTVVTAIREQGSAVLRVVGVLCTWQSLWGCAAIRTHNEYLRRCVRNAEMKLLRQSSGVARAASF